VWSRINFIAGSSVRPNRARQQANVIMVVMFYPKDDRRYRNEKSAIDAAQPRQLWRRYFGW